MIPFLLANRWARYGLAGIGVLILIGGFYLKAKHDGIEQGKQEGAQKATEQVEKLHQSDHDQTKAIIEQQAKLLETYKVESEAKSKEARGWAALAQKASQDRSEAQRSVQNTPDDALDALIKQKLGRKTDLKAPLTYGEQRDIAACLVDKPLCQDENIKLKGQIEAQKGEISAKAGSITTLETQYKTLDGYTTRLEGYYVAAYNAYPHKYRSARCLWITRCGDRKLNTPEPRELKR